MGFFSRISEAVSSFVGHVAELVTGRSSEGPASFSEPDHGAELRGSSGENWYESVPEDGSTLEQEVLHLEEEPTLDELLDLVSDYEDWDMLLIYVEGDMDEDT